MYIVIERGEEFGNDASNFLSYTKLMKFIDYEHPRITAEDGSKKPMPCCATRTGSHNPCKRANRRSDFDDFGVGSVLYFQFIKYMGCQFLVMAFLGIPAMMFFYYGTEMSDLEFRPIVQSLSLGNLGTAINTAGYGEYNEKQMEFSESL